MQDEIGGIKCQIETKFDKKMTSHEIKIMQKLRYEMSMIED